MHEKGERSDCKKDLTVTPPTSGQEHQVEMVISQ